MKINHTSLFLFLLIFIFIRHTQSICTTADNCTSCNFTYFNVSNANCSLCNATMADCTSCSSSLVCLTCDTGSYLNSTTHNCVNCTIFDPNCDNCTSSGCIGCALNLTAHFSGILCFNCTISVPNCISCNSFVECLTCTTDYLVNATKQCLSCTLAISNCQHCESYVNCTGCLSGFQLNSTNATCFNCSIIIPNCISCTGAPLCTSCSPYYYVLNGSCVLCSSALTNCSTCSDSQNCLTCLNAYSFVDPVNHLCYLCANSNVPYCLTCSSISLCTQCEELFILGVSGTACTCSSGYFLAGGACTNITGCSNALRTTYHQATCIFCNSAANFQLKSGLCSCQSGYSLKGSLCLEVCGKGYVIKNACDDGNTVSGDGCSSSCTQEAGYNCTKTAYNTVVCLQINTFTLSLLYINKVVGENSGNFVFQLSPPSSRFSSMNFSNFVTFSLQPSLVGTSSRLLSQQVVSYSCTESILTVKISYDVDIESDSQLIYFTFDPLLFQAPSFSKIISNRGSNAALIVNPFVQHEIYQFYGAFGLTMLGLAIFLLSLFFHKMIGVETIQVIQLIFFGQIYSATNFHFLPSFLALQYSNNYNQLFRTSSDSFSFGNIYQSLSFEKSFIENDFLNIVVGGFVLVVLLLIKVKEIRDSKRKLDSTLSVHEKNTVVFEWQRTNQIFYLVYNQLVFPIFMIAFFQTLGSLVVQSFLLEDKKPLVANELNTIITFCYVMALLVIISIEFLPLFNFSMPFTTKECSETYIPLYIIQMFIVISLVQDLKDFKWSIYILGSFLILFASYTIKTRPYKQFIHNFAIIFNQIFLLAYFSLVAIIQFFDQADLFYLIFGYATLGLLLIIEVLAIVRIIYARKYNMLSQKEIKKQKEAEEKQLLKEHRKRAKPEYQIEMMEKQKGIKKEELYFQAKEEENEEFLKKLKLRLKQEMIESKQAGYI